MKEMNVDERNECEEIYVQSEREIVGK